jgi:hypothetical protein
MATPETTQTIETGTRSSPRACLTSGCPCKDARIVSHRQAAFFATVARRVGETADRIIPAEPGWQIPIALEADLVLLMVETGHAPDPVAESCRPRGRPDRKDRSMNLKLNGLFALARHDDLRREAGEERLARIDRHASLQTEPRTARLSTALDFLFGRLQIWTPR